MTTDDALPAATRVGSVGLAVADLDGVAAFYRDVVGLVERRREGDRAWLGPAGGPDLLELRATDDPDDPDAAGLFHVAFRVPDRAALADARDRVSDRWELTGASDHLVSEALYLRDPEGNGVELYRDRPRSEWTFTDGGVEIDTLPLDLDALPAGRGDDRLPAGTDVGHVHLEVTDLPAAEAFYRALGMGVQARYGDQASFVAAGDYHHHVGLNTWNARTGPRSGRGLAWVRFRLPDGAALAAAADRLAAHGAGVERTDGTVRVRDPDDIPLELAVE